MGLLDAAEGRGGRLELDLEWYRVHTRKEARDETKGDAPNRFLLLMNTWDGATARDNAQISM